MRVADTEPELLIFAFSAVFSLGLELSKNSLGPVRDKFVELSKNGGRRQGANPACADDVVITRALRRLAGWLRFLLNWFPRHSI